MRQLYIIEYDNAHWCGGIMHCVAWAHSEDEAVDLAEWWMIESQLELFADQYAEEPEYEEECPYSVIEVQLLAGSVYEEFYEDPVQREAYYPCVNPLTGPHS